MPIGYTLQVPTSPLIAIGRRLMPPVLEFLGASLRVPKPGEAHYHVPIKIYPSLLKTIGPSEVANCEVYLDVYEGEERVKILRMCWGDLQQTSFSDLTLLRKHHVSLVPVAWRSEAEGEAFFTDSSFLHHGTCDHPITDRMRFRLRIKSGPFEKTSPQFYLVRCPEPGRSNGEFNVEEEYEGYGNVGALKLSKKGKDAIAVGQTPKLATPARALSGLYVGDMGASTAKLADEGFIEMHARAFNGTGQSIWVHRIRGSVKASYVLSGSGRDLNAFPSPLLVQDRTKLEHIEAGEEFLVVFEQRVPKSVAQLVLNMDNDSRVGLYLADLDVVICSHEPPQATARLPLWGGIMLSRPRADQILSNRIIVANLAPITIRAETG